MGTAENIHDVPDEEDICKELLPAVFAGGLHVFATIDWELAPPIVHV